MKCPYRTEIITVKPNNPITLSQSDGEVTITSIEHTDFEECYGEKCPFYCDSPEYREPFCKKADIEIGGECL